VGSLETASLEYKFKNMRIDLFINKLCFIADNSGRTTTTLLNIDSQSYKIIRLHWKLDLTDKTVVLDVYFIEIMNEYDISRRRSGIL